MVTEGMGAGPAFVDLDQASSGANAGPEGTEPQDQPLSSLQEVEQGSLPSDEADHRDSAADAKDGEQLQPHVNFRESSEPPKDGLTPDLDDIEVSLAPDELKPSNSELTAANPASARKGLPDAPERNDNFGPDADALDLEADNKIN